MSEYNKNGYSKLKGFLAENGIKQREVAKLLGVTDSTFSNKINKNNADFTMGEVAKMCKVFNLDSNVFFLSE